MLAHYELIKESRDEKKAGPKPGSPEAFAQEHELQATFVSRNVLIAVVNGKVLRPGDFIDEFRLVKIEPYQAEFRRGRDRVLIAIPTAPAPE